MSKSYAVEYCNLELRLDRRQIQEFIQWLLDDGYSLYWGENDRQFIISIRTGRKLIKIKFQSVGERYKIVGDYVFKDERLAELMWKMIGDTRGHAIVKKFKEHQILIENVMFGEIIKTVEINGMGHKVLFEKEPRVTMEEMLRAFQSRRIEERIPVLRMEIDDTLELLYEAMKRNDHEQIKQCKEKLQTLRKEMLLTEA